MTRQNFGLGEVIHQPVLLEEANEYVEGFLYPLWVPRPNQATICIKHPYSLTHHKYQPVMSKYFFLYCHGLPFAHHIVDNFIEEGGKYKVSLGCSSGCLEVRSMVSILPGEDHLSLPKLFQYPAHVWSSATFFQCCQEVALVQSVICFVKV